MSGEAWSVAISTFKSLFQVVLRYFGLYEEVYTKLHQPDIFPARITEGWTKLGPVEKLQPLLTLTLKTWQNHLCQPTFPKISFQAHLCKAGTQ